MHVALIVIIHFVIYSIPPIVGSFLKKDLQKYLIFAYLGILNTLTQLFNSLYAINLNSEYSINAGDISYSALIFTSLYFIFTLSDVNYVRFLIQNMLILGIFLFILLYFINGLLIDDNITNYLNIPSAFLEFGYKSFLFSFLLFSSEIVFIIFLLKKLTANIKKSIFVAFIGWGIYFIIIVLDGILYTVGINILYPNSHFSVVNSIIAKLVFGFGFGIILFILLNIRPQNFTSFIQSKERIMDYLISPQRKRLQDKLNDVEKELNELRTILPICSKCKKIRDDDGYWSKLEKYLAEREEILFSHGYCPECEQELLEKIDSL